MENKEVKGMQYPDLSGQRVVIAGGTGSVGEGIVRSYLRTGAHVIVPTRSEKSIDSFLQVLGGEGHSDRLSMVADDYTTFDGAISTADRINKEFGAVDNVVATIGGWWAGQPVWDVSQRAWDTYFVGFATTHLAMARAFIPRLPKSGSYQVIIGGSAIYPVTGSGIVSMQQAALLMMVKVLQEEAGGQRRIFSQILGPVNNRNRPMQRPEWVSAEEVGLISTKLAGNEEIASTNLQLLNKAELNKVLAELIP